MSNARKLADNLPTEGSLSGRNVIVNGEMTISQRGSSFSTGSSSIYTLDRFQSSPGSSFNFDCTMSQSSDAPTGFSNSLKVSPDSTATPSASQNGAISYKIEAQDLQRFGYGSSDAKKVTLSFYVKSNKTGTYSLQLIGYDGQGSCLTTYTINSANTWERKSITFDPDTSNAFANDNTIGILIAWHLASGPDDVRTASTSWGLSDTGFRIVSGQVNFMDSTSNEWYLTGVQLEIGSQASPFEHRTFADELQRCQRYCIVYGGVQAYDRIGVGHCTGTTTFSVVITLPVEMRAGASESTSADSDLALYHQTTVTAITAISVNYMNPKTATLTGTVASGLTGGKFTQFLTNNTTNARLTLDAEL